MGGGSRCGWWGQGTYVYWLIGEHIQGIAQGRHKLGPVLPIRGSHATGASRTANLTTLPVSGIVPLVSTVTKVSWEALVGKLRLRNRELMKCSNWNLVLNVGNSQGPISRTKNRAALWLESGYRLQQPLELIERENT